MRLNFFRSLFILTLCILCISPARAQLFTDSTRSVEELVRNHFLTPSVQVSNVKYTGSKSSLGLFGMKGDYLPIQQGLILSTGKISDAAGPNNSDRRGANVNRGPDRDLEVLTLGKVFDAAILEFDFIPNADTIYFRYIFGSEEYPEFVDSRYNDVFSFFLSGPDLPIKKNLAVLSDYSPVTINNLNHKKHGRYYIDNSFYNDPRGQMKPLTTTRNREKRENGIQFDGYTRVMVAKSAVQKGKTYHIKIAIADVSDSVYDSGVFLEAYSFLSYNKPEEITALAVPAQPIAVTENRSASPLPAIKKLDNKTWQLSLQINFAFDSDRIPDSSARQLNELADWLKSKPGIKTSITGHTDSMGTKDYNRELSMRRALSVKAYLAGKGIPAATITAAGSGFEQPVATNHTPDGRARNRRVEFIFRND